MTDVFPAADQGIGEVIADLEKQGYVNGTDFRLHYTYDARPHLVLSEEASKKYEKSHPADKTDDKASAKASGESASDAETQDKSEAPAKTTKRR
jgi:hypothetical protein